MTSTNKKKQETVHEHDCMVKFILIDAFIGFFFGLLNGHRVVHWMVLRLGLYICRLSGLLK